jgi:hypothetical protein
VQAKCRPSAEAAPAPAPAPVSVSGSVSGSGSGSGLGPRQADATSRPEAIHTIPKRAPVGTTLRLRLDATVVKQS